MNFPQASDPHTAADRKKRRLSITERYRAQYVN
jgi:hypothetical protein